MALPSRHSRRPVQRPDRGPPGSAAAGIAYNVKPTSTVLQISYARTLETPFNENLVLSSEGCTNDVLAPLLLCTPGVPGNMQPGFRNEFHAGFSRPSESTSSSAASTSGSTRTTPSTSACSATRRLPSLSTGTTRRFRALPCARTCPTIHNFSALRRHVFGRRALLPAAERRAPERLSARAAIPSASTTTRSSTRRPTCNIRFRAARARGSASTGAMTAARSPDRRPAMG